MEMRKYKWNAHEHNEEEHDVAHDKILNRHQHNERNHNDDDRAHVMVEQPPVPVRRPPRCEHDHEADEVRPHGHDGSARAAVAEAGDDHRQAQRNAVHGDVHREVYEALELGAPVGGRTLDLRARKFFAHLERTVDLVHELDDLSLVVGEPGRRVGRRSEEEHRKKPQAGGDDALDDENPSVGEIRASRTWKLNRTYCHPAMPWTPSSA